MSAAPRTSTSNVDSTGLREFRFPIFLDTSSTSVNALPLTDDTASLLFSCDDVANGGNCGTPGTDTTAEDMFFVYIEASNGFHPGGPVLAAPRTASATFSRMNCLLPADQDIVIPATEWAKIVAITPVFARVVIMRATRKSAKNTTGFNETIVMIGHGIAGATPPFR